MMGRPHKVPLRALTQEERTQLETLAKARNAPVSAVARAKQLLAVAEGLDFTHAAQAGGRTCRQSVARLVARFNRDAMRAVWGKPGGHPPVVYGPAQQERILQEFPRSGTRPDGRLVADDAATRPTTGSGWSASRLDLRDLSNVASSGLYLAAGAHLV